MSNHDDYIIEVKTVQTNAFKTLCEALKEILTDTNLIFNDDGIKIIAMDPSHTILVHLKLDHTSFEEYYCQEKTVVGVSMLNFFKLIKTMTNKNNCFSTPTSPNALTKRPEPFRRLLISLQKIRKNFPLLILLKKIRKKFHC